MRVAVIGAGPAGMTAAMQLSQGGADVDLYEASPNVGGMSRTIELWGQRVDLGPHRFFSTDSRVNRLWLSVVGDDYTMIDRLTRICYDQKFFSYPLKPLEACQKLGAVNAVLCVASYVKEQFRRTANTRDESSFESWVVRRFGQRLFETFFKSYSEKLWGIACNELSDEFAAQRIKQFSLREALLSSVSRRRARSHKTLVDRFAYPHGGTGMVYERMAQQFQLAGGRLHLNSPVRRILNDQSRVRGIELIDGGTHLFDHVISTMPLTLLVRGLNEVPAAVLEASGQLSFRNTILVYLNYDSPALFDDQWLYMHSPKLRTGRVTNFRNWVKELYGDSKSTILSAEQWCNNDDDCWTSPDDVLIEQAASEMKEAKLVHGERFIGGHVVRVPRCYPVYRRGFRQHVERIADFVKTVSGLHVIGRYGAFKYNNQDHSILAGILAAENLLAGQTHDLWEVNSDDELYHEPAITADSCCGQ